MNPKPPADKSPHGGVRIVPEQVRPGSPGEAGTGNNPHDSTAPTLQHPIPSIPDHELLRRIGCGSYGEVWLARNVLGDYRAVKVIYRDRFEHDRPFDREFEGVQKFEPISRLHESQVDILHVGRNDAAGYFYYLMELADDAGAIPNDECQIPKEARKPNDKSDVVAGNLRPSGFGIPSSFDIRNSDLYIPHTLKLDLYRRGRLPMDECIQIGLALTTALEHLHSHGLVHRDIKPSNIIFVEGVPKLADIGLVASMDATMSFVGTSGFLAPEGPGTPEADIYSLGKVLYELSTGRDRQEFPKLPPELLKAESRENAAGPVLPETENGLKAATLSRDAASTLLELNSVILKACHRNPRQRYQTAKEMAADLALLQRGKSVRRTRTMKHRLVLGTKVLVPLTALGLVVIGAYSFRDTGNSTVSQHRRAEKPEVASLCKLGRFHYYMLTEEGFAKAMESFNKALEIDPNSVEAYACIADLCVVSQPSHFLPPKAAETKMRWVRDKLMAIDSRLAEGHAVRGFISLVYDWKQDEAEKELKLALQLKPELLVAHIWHGRYLLFTRQFREAEEEFKNAQRLDPTRYGLNVHVGLPAFFARDYNRAIELFTEAVEMMSNADWALSMIGRANAEKGDYPTAIESFQRAELAGGGKLELVKQKYDDLREAYKNMGPDGYWRKLLDFVLRDYERWSAPFLAQNVAGVYAHLADKEKAFEWLDNAFQEKSERLLWLNVDPCWDNIRSEPRFVALLRKMGFAPKRSENPEVATLCKLGRFHYNKLTEEGYAKAMECFNKALEIDPNSVEAFASIADFCVGSQTCKFLPLKAAEAKLRWAGEKLMAIDSHLAESHAVEGYIKLVYDGNPVDAEKELKLAVQLDPELFIAHVWYARCLLYTGNFEEAELEFKKSRQFEPTRYGLNVFVGLPSFFARRYDRAIEHFDKAIEILPGLTWAFWMTGRAHEEKGDYQAAIEAFRKYDLASGDKPEVIRQKYDGLREAYEKSGQEGYWRERLSFVQRYYEGWGTPEQALNVAAVYARLSEGDKAFEWLDKGFQEKSEWVLWLNVDPCWDNIRSDQRFVALLNSKGFDVAKGRMRQLSPAEQAGTKKLEAYMKYEQGRAAERQGNAEGTRDGMNFMREAVELDPGFLRAWAELFAMYTDSDAPDAKTQQRAIAKKLAGLNATSADAHTAQAWLAYEDFDFAGADREFQRAIQLDPRRRWPHGYYACFLTQCGRIEEARKQLGEAERIEPGRPPVQYMLGDCFFVERNYAKALAQYEKALKLAQQEQGAYWRMGRLYEADHQILKAIDAFQTARTLSAAEPERVAHRYDALRQAFREAGERGYWAKRLEQANAELSPEKEPYYFGGFHARLGHRDQALALLEKAWEVKDLGLKFLILDQHWDDLRDNERFKELLKEIGYRTDWPAK